MMKTLTLILALAFTTPALAQSAAETCPSLGELAESIMEARQSGASVSDMMAVAEGNEFVEGLVLTAFESPRYATPEFRIREIENFRNSIEALCYSAFR
jgi:hypothetical protein